MARPGGWRQSSRRRHDGLIPLPFLYALLSCLFFLALRGTELPAHGLASLLPVPRSPRPESASIARSPSSSLDLWKERGPSVSLLLEPVERPLNRYLHKYDDYYKRAVPDWTLQYKTAEQQFLYDGEFVVTVREVTREGAIVQDAATGIVGFMDRYALDESGARPGTLIRNAKCSHFRASVMMSPEVDTLRSQTGVVFEWDDARGEGYILPTEEQDAWRMLRVLRRDIEWHGSRRLIPGQFVQFETARPEEVPIEPNDEPQSPFALRVRSPEVHFELHNPEEQQYIVPAESGRPQQPMGRSHPALQQFAEPVEKARGDSPAWLWQEQMLSYLEDEDDLKPIIPLQLRFFKPKSAGKKLLMTEEIVKIGEDWKEKAFFEGRNAYKKLKPPFRRTAEEITAQHRDRYERDKERTKRLQKLALRSQRSRPNRG